MADPDSTAETIAILRLEQTKLRKGLLAKTTVDGYAADWRLFERWCRRYHLNALPATPDTVALYLTDQLTSHKISTARRRKFAIAYRHRQYGLASPCTPEVQEILAGAQRIRAEKPRQMRPISVAELRRISAGLAGSGSIIDLRNRALLVVGWASSLRRSNLAALTISDVEFCEQGLILQIQREKQDPKGVGRLVAIPKGKNRDTDPVRVLRAWLRVRGLHQRGPLFPRLDPPHEGEPLDGESVCRVVKKVLVAVGIDSTQRGAHSLRSGMISAAAEANISALRIAAYTGQSPEIVQRYFRRTELWKNNVCGDLGL